MPEALTHPSPVQAIYASVAPPAAFKASAQAVEELTRELYVFPEQITIDKTFGIPFGFHEYSLNYIGFGVGSPNWLLHHH